jgi:hypothetical protein
MPPSEQETSQAVRSYGRVFALGAVISAVVIALVLSQLDLEQLGAALAQARWGYLIPTALLVAAGLACRAVRWRVLLSEALPLSRAFSILNVTYLINGIVPLRLGEVARAFLATRANPPVPVFHSASTIVVERLLDVLAVVVLLLLALTAAPLPVEFRVSALVFAVLASVGFAIMVGLSVQRRRALWLRDQVLARLPLLRSPRVATWYEHFLDGLRPLGTPRTFFACALWTGISWAFSVASGYVLMFAFYEQGNLAATLLFTATASFSVALPAVPGNLGTYEASIYVAMRAFSLHEPLAVVTAFAITVHGVNLGMNVLLGMIGLLHEGVSLEQLSRGVRVMRESGSGVPASDTLSAGASGAGPASPSQHAG